MFEIYAFVSYLNLGLKKIRRILYSGRNSTFEDGKLGVAGILELYYDKKQLCKSM